MPAERLPGSFGAAGAGRRPGGVAGRRPAGVAVGLDWRSGSGWGLGVTPTRCAGVMRGTATAGTSSVCSSSSSCSPGLVEVVLARLVERVLLGLLAGAGAPAAAAAAAGAAAGASGCSVLGASAASSPAAGASASAAVAASASSASFPVAVRGRGGLVRRLGVLGAAAAGRCRWWRAPPRRATFSASSVAWPCSPARARASRPGAARARSRRRACRAPRASAATRRATVAVACATTRCSSSRARSGARPAHSRRRFNSRACEKYNTERRARPKKEAIPT